MFRGMLYLALLLVLGPVAARAASVEIWLVPTQQTQSGLHEYSLALSAEAGVSVTGFSVVLVGFTSMQLDPLNPYISAPDSVFVPNVLGDDRASLVINSVAGTALATGLANVVAIATLYSPYSTHDCIGGMYQPNCRTPLEIHDHPDYFGGTVFDAAGVAITDYELHLWGVTHVPAPPVPEPSAAWLSALTLLCVAAGRRAFAA